MFRMTAIALTAGAGIAALGATAPQEAQARPSFGISTPGFSLYVGPGYGYGRGYYRPYAYDPYAYGYGYGGPAYSYGYGYGGGYGYRYRDNDRAYSPYYGRKWKQEAFEGD